MSTLAKLAKVNFGLEGSQTESLNTILRFAAVKNQHVNIGYAWFKNNSDKFGS